MSSTAVTTQLKHHCHEHRYTLSHDKAHKSSWCKPEKQIHFIHVSLHSAFLSSVP